MNRSKRSCKPLVCSLCAYVQYRQRYFTKIKKLSPPITRIILISIIKILQSVFLFRTPSPAPLNRPPYTHVHTHTITPTPYLYYTGKIPIPLLFRPFNYSVLESIKIKKQCYHYVMQCNKIYDNNNNFI